MEDTFGKDTGAFRIDKIQYYTVSTEYTIYSKFTVITLYSTMTLSNGSIISDTADQLRDDDDDVQVDLLHTIKNNLFEV